MSDGGALPGIFFDREGLAIAGGVLEFAKLFEDPDYQLVAYDVVGSMEVSTVWLGIDVGVSFRPGPPLIFETMVFEDAGDEQRIPFGQRYCTEADALIGHAAAVEWASSESRVVEALGGMIAVAIAQQTLRGK